MKALIAIFILSLSLNSFAIDALNASADSSEITIGISELTGITSGDSYKREAAKIINDSQDFFQSGRMSEFLSEKIAIIQMKDQSLSAQDAIDTLIVISEDILK